MFVEKKQNKSGSTSVRIMRKVHGKKEFVKAVGCSSDAEEIDQFVKRGNRWIEEHQTGSKLRTAEYMERFMHKSYSVDTIYRFLDELCARDKTPEQVREAEDESIGVRASGL